MDGAYMYKEKFKICVIYISCTWRERERGNRSRLKYQTPLQWMNTLNAH